MLKMDENLWKEKMTAAVSRLYGIGVEEATEEACYLALTAVMKEYIGHLWQTTREQDEREHKKEVYYLSIEFLPGKLTAFYLTMLGMEEACRKGLAELGLDLDRILKADGEAAIGSGGLGRLAACFLDSLAALGLPGHGMGIRYQQGLFAQQIINYQQVEVPETWLAPEYTWEECQEERVLVPFGGQVVYKERSGGEMGWVQENYQGVTAVPYDIPVLGHQGRRVNTLRLWSAGEDADISRQLYPDDGAYEGRLLRLKQEYFLVSASLQSLLARCRKRGIPPVRLADYIALHINDTHPALAVPELMRLLLDEEGLDWETAWKVTVKTVSYTNHTVMPEALEKWPALMLQQLLPRIYMILCEMNDRLCRWLELQYPGDKRRIEEMAVIHHGEVYMARLAALGSHSINGVAALHSQIVREHVLKWYYQVYPQRFNNKTNGISHRRWLHHANRPLAGLIAEGLGKEWLYEPEQLLRLLAYKEDSVFLEKLAKVKQRNKQAVAGYIQQKYGVALDCDSVFHLQIKRIHGYKRQLLSGLYLLQLYYTLKENPGISLEPATFIFAGKAAPGYVLAKETIRFLSQLSALINRDPQVSGRLRVFFLENYNVALGELLFPAAEISEQLSTASREASGTGNMKAMMNGAVTLGTMDGANIEIAGAVGEENFFSFGLDASQVLEYYHHGGYDPRDVYNTDERLRRIVNQLAKGLLDGEGGFPALHTWLMASDEFVVLKDFSSYEKAQARAAEAYKDQKKWQTMSLINIAHSGCFSSDYTIRDYAEQIWKMNVSAHTFPKG